jgi:succinate dehydrogenase / fumarate reductase cytochrome b subunit
LQRPLSPHLQVYKPQITSVMSILHRASGIFIAIGLVLIALLLIAVPYGESVYSQVSAFYSATPIRLLLLLFAVAFFYHFCNGLRHLRWDMVKGLNISSINKTAWFVWGGVVVFMLLLVF